VRKTCREKQAATPLIYEDRPENYETDFTSRKPRTGFLSLGANHVRKVPLNGKSPLDGVA